MFNVGDEVSLSPYSKFYGNKDELSVTDHGTLTRTSNLGGMPYTAEYTLPNLEVVRNVYKLKDLLPYD